jgi:hypothetical protein
MNGKTGIDDAVPNNHEWFSCLTRTLHSKGKILKDA